MKSKVFAILLSFVVAFSLWFYVITVVSPESEKVYYDIPVVLQNKDILSERGLMVVSDEPKVTLALKSDRTILNDLNESNINVIINLANIDKPGAHNLTYTVSYPGNIPSNAISVQSSSTDLIILEVEKKLSKTVPVEVLHGDSKVPDDYFPGDVIKEPGEIEISGPESVVSQITQAVIRIDLNNQTKTLSGEYKYSLCNAQGEPVNAEKVTVNKGNANVTVPIYRTKKVQLDIGIHYGGGATEQNTAIERDLEYIDVYGSDELIAELPDVLHIGDIHLNQLLEDQELTFPITLPEGVGNLTGMDAVTVQVKFTGLSTKTFNVTSITPVNQPENVQLEIKTKALSVKIRGPEEIMKKLTTKDLKDLKVEVDLSGAQVGTASMTASVIIPPAYPELGAVGTYQVSVTLR